MIINLQINHKTILKDPSMNVPQNAYIHFDNIYFNFVLISKILLWDLIFSIDLCLK